MFHRHAGELAGKRGGPRCLSAGELEAQLAARDQGLAEARPEGQALTKTLETAQQEAAGRET